MANVIESLLDRLLATSVQTALLAAVVWLICRFVPRLSPTTQCWLWWLVALQVLLGLCVDPMLLPLLPQEPAVVPVLTSATDWNQLGTGAAAMQSAGRSPLLWQAGVFALWASGFAVMAWSTLRSWRRTRGLRANSLQCTDELVLGAVAQAAAARGLRRVPLLCMSPRIESPMVIGHFRPVLLLPAETTLSNEELEMAVAHELEHLRRADLWWGFIPSLARHCFFFHPLVHLAVREYGIAREAACDVAVVDAGLRSRRDYGQLLVRLGTADPGTGLAAASPTFRELSRRLMLLQHSSFLPRAGSIVVLLLAVAGVMPLRLVAAASPVLVAAQSSADKLAPPAVASIADRITSQPTLTFIPNAADYYPAASRDRGEEGIVNLRLCYDETGKVIESTVRGSSGFPRLDDAAVRMGKMYRIINFAADSGKAQAGCVITPVRFSATAKPADASQTPRYTGERMTANFQDIPVVTLLKLISETSGQEIIVDQSVTGSVTMNVHDVPWDQVLDIVLRTKGLEKRMEGNSIVVAASDKAQ